MPACAVEDEDRMGTGGLVPRLAQMRVRVPCWPTLAFAGKTVPRTVFLSGSPWNQISSGLSLARAGIAAATVSGKFF